MERNEICLEEIESFSIVELKEELKKRKLRRIGNKAELKERLRAAVIVERSMLDAEDGEPEDEDNYSDEYEDVQEPVNDEADISCQALAKPFCQCSVDRGKTTFNFKDVEDHIRKFDGKSGLSVEEWLYEFEQNAEIFNWSELQKLVYVRKFLEGRALKFIRSERNIITWLQFKKLIIAEFRRKMCPAEIHAQLAARTLRSDETAYDYYLDMKEMAGGLVDDASLRHHVISGMSDAPKNKLTLYEAKTTEEFKEKLQWYDKARELTVTERKPYVTNTVSSLPFRCYNCGEEGHRASECRHPKREKGSCYNCGSVQHQVSRCPKNRDDRPVQRIDLIEGVVKAYTYEIDVPFLTKPTTAVLDTGCPFSLLRRSVVPGDVQVSRSRSSYHLEGVNRSQVEVLGEVRTNISVAGTEIPITFLVVPEMTMSCNCLLGRDFISNDLLIIEFGKKVNIKSRSISDVRDEVTRETVLNEIFPIDFVEINSPSYKISRGDRENLQLVFDNCVKPSRLDDPETSLELEIMVKPTHVPFCYNPRRLTVGEKESEKEKIDLLSRRIVRGNKSQYSGPLVQARKKCGQLRMDVDYRALNKITDVDVYGPLERSPQRLKFGRVRYKKRC